jgi:hypothetical protein
VVVGVGNVSTLSLRQRIIPGPLLGRVGAAFRTLIFGLVPLGALAGGLLASDVGVARSFAVAGGIQLVVMAVVGPTLVARIRTVERPSRVVISLVDD